MIHTGTGRKACSGFLAWSAESLTRTSHKTVIILRPFMLVRGQKCVMKSHNLGNDNLLQFTRNLKDPRTQTDCLAGEKTETQRH